MYAVTHLFRWRLPFLQQKII